MSRLQATRPPPKTAGPLHSARAGLLAVLAVFAIPSWAQSTPENSDDEVFTEYDLIQGKRTTQEQCNSTRYAVWVEHAEGRACIRYFPSSNIDGVDTAAFFFHGDTLSGRFVIQGAYDNNRASLLLKASQNLASVNQVPYIFVARPGVYGSSGRHTERRALAEYLALNAAIDAIKTKHHIRHVHLAGQSGGASAVGALLTLGRTDVICAAASSGGYNAMARAHDWAIDNGIPWRGCDTHGVCGPYNVVDHTGGVARSTERRIFLIGDPQDTNTAFKYQEEFAEKLRVAGHAVVLVPAQATGAAHHSLSHMANRTLGWCNAGLPTEDIVQRIRSGAYGLNDVRNTKQ